MAIEDGRRVIKFTDRGRPFPSLVIIDRVTGHVYCGREAWNRREELRESCEVIPSVKTFLASDRVWNIAGRTWTPEMVASRIFHALKGIVKKRMGSDELKEAVVAVPVGFSASKRAALREAARIAGIEIKSFVSEPTAALFRHYSEIGHYTRIGVFDWGGGTLDVSIIENRNGRVRELATGGLNIGGDCIDRLMAEMVHSRIARNMNKKISFDQMSPVDRDKMLAACERAKIDLTWDDLVEIRILNYGPLGEVNESINLENFTRLIMPQVDRAIQCFENCVQRAGMSLAQLDCVLMVGGSVNLRPFNERVARLWEGKEFYPQDSDWSVASGAASLCAHPDGHLLAQTVGLVMSDGSLYPLMKKGEHAVTENPVTSIFALVEDEPAANLIFADDEGNTLGYINVPAFGFFREKIEVKAQIDRDLILHIQARSMNRSSRTTQKWHYDSLRMDYQLPVDRLEVEEDE
ncbi:Hsp70 family protein [Syntrophothermus sp.]|uniref:Hsp70 family protein n=1 Tax=Syntrophothermus sp. TaxID=2736299 RepID=UPI00338DBCFC